MPVKFKALIHKPDLIGSMNYIQIPFNPKHEFGKSGSIKVKGKINNTDFENFSLIPVGDGSYIMNLKDALIAKARATIGEMTQFELELDKTSHELPLDFLNALEKDYIAKEFFNNLKESQKTHFLNWIDEAKKDLNRNIRIKKSVEMLRNHQKFGE